MSDVALAPAIRRSIGRWSVLLSLAAVAIPAFGLVSMTIAQHRDHAWGPRLVMALADELARLLEPSRAASGNSLVLDVPDGLSVHTDPVRLRQILLNLLSNALKFTEDGEARLVVRVEGEQCRFEVHDDGIGIAPSDQERIFASFAQVDGSSTRSRDGVGLGLALSRDLAVRLDGTLTVDSALGEGSRFVLTLPA